MATKTLTGPHLANIRRALVARFPHVGVSSLAVDPLVSQDPPRSPLQSSLSHPARNEEVASVAIVGAPNAGKSTLMNRLIGARIAAVSRKVNTTRRRIVGVHTSYNKQLIFWDTPGVVERQFQSSLGSERRELASAGWGAAVDADVALMVVDASRKSGHLDIAARLLGQLAEFRRLRAARDGLVSPPALLLVLNKCDVVRPRSRLLDMTLAFQEQVPDFEKVVTDPVFTLSAYNGVGVPKLREVLLSKTQPAPFECEPDAVTEEEDVDVLEQHVWEKLLHRVHQEVPYQCRLQIEDWREFPNGSLGVSAVIRVPKKRHIPILVGPHGDIVKWIAEKSSESASIALKRNIRLRLRVAVGGGDV